MRKPNYPPGWDEDRVRRVLDHYESQSGDEALAEDESVYEATTHTRMEIPVELLSRVRQLIAERESTGTKSGR